MVKKKCQRCGGSGDEPDHKLIGSRLRSEREAVGFTQNEVAAALGISQPYLWQLENGDRKWSPGMVGLYKSAITKTQKQKRNNDEQKQSSR